MTDDCYQVTKHKSKYQLRFVFVSQGRKKVVKIIDYTYVGLRMNTRTFNLGFGDYSPLTKTIDDLVNTDNGDVYLVLNTVLNTVPIFFKEYPNCLLMVKGSDCGDKFLERCHSKCTMGCKTMLNCKRQNRRINIYVNYVNSNYTDLVKEFDLFGGNNDIHERFKKDVKYDTVFILKKLKFEI